MKVSEIKKQVYSELVNLIDNKVIAAETAVLNAKESRNNETKSSAGDKHETARAMSQIELDNNEIQLGKVLDLKRQLLQIDIRKRCNKVELGSLVSTNHGTYFICIGYGKIEIKGEIYYAISLASPLGKVLNNKSVNEKFHFNAKDFVIMDII